MVMNYFGKPIETCDIEGVVYFKGNDMADSKTLDNWKRGNNAKRYIDNLVYMCGLEGTQLIISTEGKKGGTWIHEKLAFHLLRYIDKGFDMLCNTQLENMFKGVGFNIDNLEVKIVERYEITFGNKLIEALKEVDLEVMTQFNVDGYKVDFYIPSLNIAIEYDEEQHFTTTNQQKDAQRQAYIENKMDAKFIRCDYRDSDIKNVMKVLKAVM